MTLSAMVPLGGLPNLLPFSTKNLNNNVTFKISVQIESLPLKTGGIPILIDKVNGCNWYSESKENVEASYAAKQMWAYLWALRVKNGASEYRWGHLETMHNWTKNGVFSWRRLCLSMYLVYLVFIRFDTITEKTKTKFLSLYLYKFDYFSFKSNF